MGDDCHTGTSWHLPNWAVEYPFSFKVIANGALVFGRNELLPVDWFPEIQPVFYVGFQVTRDAAMTRRSAEHLSRWLLSPLGPDFLDEEVVHAVLVMVKAAEYTGVRWYTDPARANWYNDLMLEWYGPTHDAYRTAFVVEAEAVAELGP